MRTLGVLTVAAALFCATGNAQAELVPDLIPYATEYLEFPLVPGFCGTVPCTLMAGPLPPERIADMHFSFGILNQGTGYAPESITTALLGRYLSNPTISPAIPGLWPGGTWSEFHWSPPYQDPWWLRLTGRRRLGCRVDGAYEVVELNESNNNWERQFVFDGLDYPIDAILEFDFTSSTGAWPNCAGMRLDHDPASWWYGFAVSGPCSEVKLHQYEEPSNEPDRGWRYWNIATECVSSRVDFVLVDANHAAAASYFASAQIDDWSFNSTYLSPERSSEIEVDGDPLVVGNGPGHLIALVEVWGEAGQEVGIGVGDIGDLSDVALHVFDGDSIYHTSAPGAAMAFADNSGAGGDEVVSVTFPNDNYYCIVVSAVDWEEGTGHRLPQCTVSVKTKPDLQPLTPGIWYGPIVPRHEEDSTPYSAPLPALLWGGLDTHFNWGGLNVNAVESGPFVTDLFVDDEPRWYVNMSSKGFRESALAMNTPSDPPFSTVWGGRHHLRSFIDSQNDVDEELEDNNNYVESFVWTPLILASGQPLFRQAPPICCPFGWGPWFSSDGYRSIREADAVWWSAFAVLPEEATAEFDAYAYLPSTGSQSGFAEPVAGDQAFGGGTTFNIVNYNRVQENEVDFAAVNFTGHTGDFAVELADALGTELVNSLPHVVPAGTIAAGSIVKVHELEITQQVVGLPISIALGNVSGNADLGFAVFDNDETFGSPSTALVDADLGGDGADESATVVFDTADYYGLVVYKVGSSDLGKNATYGLELSLSTTGVDTPGLAPPPAAFALRVAGENPFHQVARLDYDVPVGGGEVRVVVFDVAGRQVRTLVEGSVEPGRHPLHWDGADQAGRAVSPGVYFVQFETPEGRFSEKLILTR